MDSLPETKVCTKCHEEKPMSEFGNAKKHKDGKRYECRVCSNAAALAWHYANRDRALQTMKERYWSDPESARSRVLDHYYANHEEEKAKWREYYAQNKETLKPARQAWQEANKEEVRLKKKQYRKNNQDKVRKDTRARRARLANVESETYTEQDIFNRWGTNCHVCGEPVDLQAPRLTGDPGWERGLHLDHVVPLVAGGSDTIENVKPSHGLCNLRKSKSI